MKVFRDLQDVKAMKLIFFLCRYVCDALNAEDLVSRAATLL
jgi:hypothetical protein